MGILNVTPDSFSDGGMYTSKKTAIDHVIKMIKSGADIIDIGGESTRPGSEKVKIEEELKRVLPILNNISNLKNKVPISLDTRKPEVMMKGLKKGVDIINDVSGLRYSRDTIPLMKKTKSPIVIMHSISTPKLMQKKISYKNVLIDIYDFLEKKINQCEKNNIDRSRIIIDPGIGFGKNLKQNLNLIKNISLFHSLGVSILLGSSRKTFISKISKNALENERLGGSISSVIYALNQGVQIFRVHDVIETKQALDVYNKIKRA
jgi:dihydropteroate synthase